MAARGPTEKQLLLASTANQEAIQRSLDALPSVIARAVEQALANAGVTLPAGEAPAFDGIPTITQS